MRIKFSKLFDDAPQIPYSAVLSVFESELGRPPSGPNGVFEIFEEEAVASASIAQVHRAKLWDGDWVAVKVQKPDVGKQVEWDLGAFRICMWMFEHWVFDMVGPSLPFGVFFFLISLLNRNSPHTFLLVRDCGRLAFHLLM